MSLQDKWKEFGITVKVPTTRDREDAVLSWHQIVREAFYAGAEAGMDMIPIDVPMADSSQKRLEKIRAEIDHFKARPK